ncbi:MAG: DegV family protein [Chloroflexi bacterium]|nr:DegV family protein [Chloroflexota bacterium]
MTINLVTDSTADVPPDLVERHGIRVVPSLVVMGGQSFRDSVDISREEYYRRLAAFDPLPTTAAPAAGEFETVYASLPEGPIVSIHTAATLSGIYNAARLGAEPFGGRVRVIDAGSLSMGVGWPVIAAAEAIAAGLALEAVLEAVASTIRRTVVLALLDTVDNLRRSGRISLLRASIAGVLQIKPLIELAGGALKVIAQNRTRHKAMPEFIAQVKAMGRLERLAVMYTDNASLAADVRDQLAGQCAAPAPILQAAPTIGTHIGPNAVAVAIVK